MIRNAIITEDNNAISERNIDDVPDEVINDPDRPINRIRVSVRTSIEQYEHNLNNNIPEEPRNGNNEEVISNNRLNVFDPNAMLNNNMEPHTQQNPNNREIITDFRQILNAQLEDPANRWKVCSYRSAYRHEL